MTEDDVDFGNCPLCGHQLASRTSLFAVQASGPLGRTIFLEAADTGSQVNCRHCGDFVITDHDEAHFLRKSGWNGQADKWRISGLIHEHTIRGLPVIWLRFRSPQYYWRLMEAPPYCQEIREFVPGYHEELLKNWPHTVMEKLDRTLCNLARLSDIGGKRHSIKSGDNPLVFARNDEEADYHVKCLIDLGLLKDAASSNDGWEVALNPDGWSRFDELTRTTASRDNPVFVAMWFGSDDKSKAEMEQLYQEGIEPGVREAGYFVTRADLEPHNDFIMNKVLGDIRVAPFIVADFTGHRNGVYFEAGFARGLSIPVIHTCRSDVFAHAHFDTKQLPHLIWNTPAELRQKLREWVPGWLGIGPRPTSDKL